MNKFEAAFKAAQDRASVSVSDMDLLIIDQVFEVCDRINKIDGFIASVERVSEYDHDKSLNFRFTVLYNNMSQDFTLQANKPKYRVNPVEYSVREGFMGDNKKIRLKNDADIEGVLLTIVDLLGQAAAESMRGRDLQDALARRRLLGKMPEIKL